LKLCVKKETKSEPEEERLTLLKKTNEIWTHQMLLPLKTIVDGWLFCGLKAENFQILEEA